MPPFPGHSISAHFASIWSYIFSFTYSELFVAFFSYAFLVRLKRKVLHLLLGAPISPLTAEDAEAAAHEGYAYDTFLDRTSVNEHTSGDTSTTELRELRVMPYVVPTSPTRTSPGSPLSPVTAMLALSSSPPIPFSISLSPPAPVPNFVPFPSSSSNSRRDENETPLSTSAPSGSSDLNVSHVFPRPAPPLLKSQSHTTTSTISTPSSHASSTPSPRSTPSEPSSSPRPFRRTASASSAEASPLASRHKHHRHGSHEFGSIELGRHENSAGRGLTHIPRRATGSGLGALINVSGSASSANESPAKRRSRFLVGSDGSGSGSDGDKDKKGDEKEKEEKEIEKREVRKRPVSAERVLSVGCSEDAEKRVAVEGDALVFEMDFEEPTPPATINSQKNSARLQVVESSSESDSDSVSPLPASGARDREHRGRREKEKELDGLRAGKRLEGKKRRSALIAETRSIESSEPEAKSSVAFPSSSPPSPPDSDATVQVDQSKSFKDKRSNASALHIDLPNPASSAPSSSPPKDVVASATVAAIEIPTGLGEGHHGRLHLTRANYSPPVVRGVFSLAPTIHVAALAKSPPVRSTGGKLRASASTSMVPIVRKKSGEVLKPSLKRRSSSASGGPARAVVQSLSLGDLTGLQVLSPSLSAPATPVAMDDDAGSMPSSVHSATAKMVHFDAQLEHVKLFLAEQKPAAVSRDGSPTLDDTTSGGESGSEWDAFNYGGGGGGYFGQWRKRLTDGASSEEEAAVRKVLVMRVLNMPNREAKSASGSVLGANDDGWGAGDVWLEGLHLADDASCVKGTVRVRNIAFEKSVVVRFTFDGWQTTSEVSARWVQSCSPPPRFAKLPSDQKSGPESPAASTGSSMAASDENPAYDRFEFAIKLSDLLLRIDEKTLVLAVRYCAGGREMWDNNNGQNYRAVFEKRLPGKNALDFSGTAVISPGSGPGSGGLDKGKKDGNNSSGRDNALGLSLQGALERITPSGKSGGARDSDSSSSGLSSMTKRNADSLASRYDLGASLKKHTPWRPILEHAATWVPPSPEPSSTPHNGHSTVPWPAKKSASHIDGLPQTWGNVKLPTFASHKVDFGIRAQGLARGSPRDSDADDLDDEELAKYQRRTLGMSHTEGQNGPLGPSSRRGLNVSSSSNGSSDFHGFRSHAASSVRNHHRSYFDAWAASHGAAGGKTRLTPSGMPHRSLSDAELTAAIGSQASSLMGTPISELPITPGVTSPGRYHSFPPLGSGPSSPGRPVVQQQIARPRSELPAGVQMGMGSDMLGLGVRKGADAADSEISTPSITNVSSPTMTPSPESPLDFAMLTPNFTTSPTKDGAGEHALMDSNSYSLFLNRFCFYTGRESSLDVPPDMHRSHSASEVEELLSSPTIASTEAFPFLKGATPTASPRASTPPRPTNLDHSSSGFSTPTAATLLKSESPLSTPVHG